MLPIKTLPEDVVGIVEYLKTKATGATVVEAKATVNKRLLDDRKLKAYDAWGFISRDGGRLKLTELGRRFGRSGPEQRGAILGEAIKGNSAYRLALEWIFHSNLQIVSTADLAAHWHEHLPNEVGTAEDSIREQANCFFQLAEGANLGRFVIGRGGGQTRFEANREAIGQLIAEIGFGGEQRTEAEPVIEAAFDAEVPATAETPSLRTERPPETPPSEQVTPQLRVFISHGKNTDIVDQMRTMLDLADLPYEVAVDEETTAIPVPDKVLSAMRRCTAALICVTVDPDASKPDGTFAVNQNVLIEIGAAFVLYDKRVVLVWDRRIPIPSNLQGLYRCEFEGDELSWSAGMKLMKAVAQFKKL